MSRRNWLSHAPLGVGLAVAAALFGAGLINDRQHPNRSDSSAQQNSENTLDGVQQPRVAIVGGQETAPTDPESKRKEWREEQDLEAQWEQAKWAKYAVLIALGGVLVTAVGVWFVKQTLDTTRVALGEAERSSNAAVAMARAMVGLELPIIHARPMVISLLAMRKALPRAEPGTQPYGGTGNHKIPTEHSAVSKIPFRNFGRTPAFLNAISLGFSVTDKPSGEPEYTRHIRLNPDTIIRPEPQEGPTDVDIDYGIDLLEDELALLGSGAGDLWVYCALFYSDFMREPHESRYCWRWAQRPKGRGIYFFDAEGDTPAAYVRHT
jgi:hypothetical protein